MNHVIPVASGKGGVGKTLVAANLGIALARRRKTVVLIDLDLGGSNLHTVLGIRNRHPGIGHFIHGHAATLEELLVQTRQDRLFFIAGDALFSGTANLPYWKKVAITRQVGALPADFVVLDLGAGTSYNTIDLFLASGLGLIVTTPDTTAILNAYLFLKSTMLRMLQRAFPAKSAARSAVFEFTRTRVEGGDVSLTAILAVLDSISADAGDTARAVLGSFRPRIVMNLGRTPQDIQLGTRLRTIARNNLACEPTFLGYLPYDPTAAKSALDRSPTMLAHPECPFARGIDELAGRLADHPVPIAIPLLNDDEDLASLEQQFSDLRESH